MINVRLCTVGYSDFSRLNEAFWNLIRENKLKHAYKMVNGNPMVVSFDNEGHHFVWEPLRTTRIKDGRNYLIHEDRESRKDAKPIPGFAWFGFIDTDNPHSLESIMRKVTSPHLIIGSPYLGHDSTGKYCLVKAIPEDGPVERYATDETGVKKVFSLAGGSLFIRRQVLEELDPPYFREPMVERGDYRQEMGEDTGFCMYAAENGFESFCDFDDPIEHLPVEVIWTSRQKGKIVNEPKRQPQEQTVRLPRNLDSGIKQLNRLSMEMGDLYEAAIDHCKDLQRQLEEAQARIKHLEPTAKPEEAPK